MNAIPGAQSKRFEGIAVGMLVFNSLDRDPRVWKEAISLARAGATVEILMLRKAGQQEAEELVPGVTVRRISPYSPADRRVRSVLVGGRAFLRHVRAGGYDVCHCHDGATLLWGLAAVRASKARLIYDAHEFFPGFTPTGRSSAWRASLAYRLSMDRLFEKAFIRRASAVITVNDSIAAMLTYAHRLRLTPTVLRNSIPYWEPDGSEAGKLHRAIGVPDSAPLLLFQGGVNPDRGVDHCIAALTALPDVHLAVLGTIEGQLQKDLESIAVDLDVSNRVHFVAPVPYSSLLSYTASADLGIYVPSETDVSLSYRFSLPNKVFEYAVARTPSVMANLPEIGRALETYDCGVVAQDSSPAAIAAAVAYAMERPRSEWDSSLKRAAHDLAWERDEMRLLCLYERVLASSS